jgi:hypothetical protein
VPGGFRPSRDGFAFTNSWPSQPGVVLPFRGRQVGFGDAARGLCGGMVFAALDYWHAGVPPPAGQPAGGTPLYQFIVRRLIDSWHIPAGVGKYYQWMNRADVGRLSAEREWPRIRASIDAGQPAPLGVVTVASARPDLLGRNHQVLAYAYEQSGGTVTLAVYDPNSGPDDRIRIAFDASPAIEHNLNIGWPVRGFFRTGYAPVAPPVLPVPPVQAGR